MKSERALLHGTFARVSVRKCHVQSGREYELVPFLSGRRIGDVAVRRIILRSQEFDDRGNRADAEVDPVAAAGFC